MDPAKQPGISVAQIFLDSFEFRQRIDALTLPANTALQLGALTVVLELVAKTDDSAGLVKITVCTPQEGPEPLYVFRLAMVALLEKQQGAENMRMDEYLKNSGASLLYPFVREALGTITQKGRFGAVWLNPINFRALATNDWTAGTPTGFSVPTAGGTASEPAKKPARKRNPKGGSASAHAPAVTNRTTP